jgi:hypothetical protein
LWGVLFLGSLRSKNSAIKGFAQKHRWPFGMVTGHHLELIVSAGQNYRDTSDDFSGSSSGRTYLKLHFEDIGSLLSIELNGTGDSGKGRGGIIIISVHKMNRFVFENFVF